MASSFSHITHEYIGAANQSKLALLREKVDLAEAGLRNARDQYEAEAVRQGNPKSCLFSFTFFVKRSSAEKWLDEAQHEFDAREAQNFQHVKAALQKLAAKKADNDDPDEDPGDEGDDSPHDPPEDSGTAKKRRREAEKKRREAIGEDDEAAKAARFFAPRAADAEYWDWVKQGAAAIVRAAARRRGEAPKRPDWELQGATAPPRLTVVPGAPLPPKGTTARAIIDAGKRRRGEEV